MQFLAYFGFRCGVATCHAFCPLAFLCGFAFPASTCKPRGSSGNLQQWFRTDELWFFVLCFELERRHCKTPISTNTDNNSKRMAVSWTLGRRIVEEQHLDEQPQTTIRTAPSHYLGDWAEFEWGRSLLSAMLCFKQRLGADVDMTPLGGGHDRGLTPHRPPTSLTERSIRLPRDLSAQLAL